MRRKLVRKEEYYEKVTLFCDCGWHHDATGFPLPINGLRFHSCRLSEHIKYVILHVLEYIAMLTSCEVLITLQSSLAADHNNVSIHHRSTLKLYRCCDSAQLQWNIYGDSSQKLNSFCHHCNSSLHIAYCQKQRFIWPSYKPSILKGD